MKSNNFLLKVGYFIIPLFMFFNLQAQKVTQQDLFYITQLMVQDKIKKKNEVRKDERTNFPIVKDTPAKSRSDEEIVINETPEAEAEIHVVINPLDTNNLVVAAMRMTETPGGVLNGLDLTFPIYYTEDFGKTWSESEFNGIPTDFNFTGGGDPVLTFDKEGKVHLFWLLAEEVSSSKGRTLMAWATSSDGGQTFALRDPVDETEVELTTLLGVTVATGGDFVDKEWVVVDNSPESPYQGNTYFSYTHISISLLFQDYQIRFKKREAGEDKFSENPVVLGGDDFGFIHFSSLDTDKDGNIHVSFFGQLADEEIFYLFYTGSTDGGNTFSTPTKIAPVHLPCFPPNPNPFDMSCQVTGIGANRVYPCNHIRVGKSNNANQDIIYVVWSADGLEEELANGLDIYFSKSMDDGATWSSPIIVNDDIGIDGVTDNFFPAMEVTENGKVGVAWYDRRNDEQNIKTDYYMAWSEDEGNSFESNIPLTSQSSDFSKIGNGNDGLGVGEYNSMVTTPNGAMIFWSDGRTNDGNIDIYAKYVPVGQQISTSLTENILISTDFQLKKVYPVPTEDNLNLEIFLQNASALSLEIFDNLGRLQQFESAKAQSGNQSLTINTSNLVNGVHYIKVNSDYGYIVRKFIVEK